MKSILLFVLLTLPILSFSQLIEEYPAPEITILSNGETLDFINNFNDYEALFPGGLDSLKRYFQEKIIFPKTAIENKIIGTVRVRLAIDPTGKVSNLEILEEIQNCPECNELIVNAIIEMPLWLPPTSNTIKKYSWFTIPFNFNYTEEKTPSSEK